MNALPVRTPTVPPATHTNSYRVGNVVFDPASPYGDEQDRLATWAEGVEAIVLTHHHLDHIGGVVDLQRRTGAIVYAHPDSRLPFAFAPIVDGQQIATSEGTLTALHTPGHADGHLCFVHASGAILAGDMVAGTGTIVLVEPEGHLGTYLDSLARLLPLGGRLYPAHGPDLDTEVAVSAYVAHRHRRTEQFDEALRAGPLTPEDIAATVYAGVPGVHLGLAGLQVATHLTWLEERGRVRRRTDGTFSRE